MYTDDVSHKLTEEALEVAEELMGEEGDERSTDTEIRIFFHRILSTNTFDAIMGVVISS